jgi:hypothetical protein
MNLTRGRAVLAKSIDCTDHMAEGWRKGAAYIASQTISTIEEFSPKMLFKLLWMELIRQVGPHNCNLLVDYLFLVC